MRRIDFHVHAKLSKMFLFDPSALYTMIAQSQRVGLDGFALTEHFHAANFWGVHDELCRRFSYEDGVYVVDEAMRILTGAELSLRETCDVLLLGSLERLRRFDGSLARPATAGYKPLFAEAVAAARQAGLFMIGAHMFRPGKELAKLGSERLQALDALEANGKDFFGDTRVIASAQRMGRPVVGGSDAHYWPQVGIKSTVLPIAEVSHAAVVHAIREGRGRIESLSYGPLAVRISGTHKYVLKAKQRLRGVQPVQPASDALERRVG